MAWDDDAVDKGGPLPKAAPKAPAVDPLKYRLNQLNLGAADTVGSVLDFGPRVANLAAAAYGATVPRAINAIAGTNIQPPDLPLPSNAGTEFMQRLFGASEMQRPASVGQIESLALRGGGAAAAMPVGSLSQLAMNALSGAGAGAGAGAALEVFPDSPTAAVVGGLVGGVAVPAIGGTVGMARRAMNEARAPVTAQNAETLAKSLIERQTRQSVGGTPNAAENIDEALRLKQKFGPEFQPSIGQMTGSEGAIELQRRYASLSPQILNEELARVEQSRNAIKTALDAQRSGKAASIARTDVNQSIAGEASRATAKAADIADQLPVTNQQAIGTRAAELAGAQKTAAQKTVTENYEKAFGAAGDSKDITLKAVVDQVEEILGTKLSQIKPENAPATARRILDLVKPKGGMSDEEAALRASLVGGNVAETSTDRMMVSLRDADSIRRAINQDIASAGRSMDPTAAMRLRNLGQLHRTLDDAVRESAVPQQAKSLYNEALAKYRQEYVPRFKEGTNLRMFRDSSLNEPRITPDKFTSEYFKPDAQAGITRAQQFGKLFAGNAEATSLAKSGIVDLYRSSVINPQTGLIDVAKHNQFLKTHARTLNEWKAQGVNVADDLTSIGAKAGVANEGIDAVANTAKFLKYDTPQDLAKAALASPKVMANALGRMSPNGRNAMRDMIVESAWGDGSAAHMAKFIKDNERTMKMAMSPKHIDDLKDVSKGLEIMERSPINVKLQTGGPDVVKNETGVSMATIYAQMRATSAGRQAPMTMAFNLAAPVLTRMSRLKFQDAMHAALYDENAAKHLSALLKAPSAGQANMAASALDNAVKAWNAAKGPLARILGAGNVMPQLGRAAPAIMSVTQEVAGQQ